MALEHSLGLHRFADVHEALGEVVVLEDPVKGLVYPLHIARNLVDEDVEWLRKIEGIREGLSRETRRE